MAKINLLPKSVSELIAAGEVVERPASVIKETVENSIDAGATRITAEIKHGGVSFIRITDNGCGISREDVPTAFLRHATSKIKTADDLDAIQTLGFRGEALAAISGVSLTEVITKTADSETGTHYVIEGGAEKLNEETGCPDGTTLIVRNLFYNVPARMKFLKKDATEATAVGAVLERMALSHPEIAFRFIRDEKQVFSTSGDGNLYNTIYSVLGRDFHSSLIEVSGESTGVTVKGYTCKPVFCRASRANQFTFLNGRIVISRTVIAAAEAAYKESSMVGKFPGFVLFITTPPETVDVNVHPAKTEVRFFDEKRIFQAVFSALKGAINSLDTRPEMPIKKQDNFFKMTAQQYRQTAVVLPEEPKSHIQSLRQDNVPFFMRDDVKAEIKRQSENTESNENKEEFIPQNTVSVQTELQKAQENHINPNLKPEEKEYNPETEVRLIGEAFGTYIIAQKGGELYFIDKHAAHERIIYNRLKAENNVAVQNLLSPVTVRLTAEEHDAVLNNRDLLLKAGFETEDFGGSNIVVRSVPAALGKVDVADCITEAVSTLIGGGTVNTETLDNIRHSVACKAAIKAGYITSDAEKLALAKEILADNDVMYCPHGRPVAYLVKKSALDRYFGRTQ